MIAVRSNDPVFVTTPGDLIWLLLAEPCALGTVVDEIAALFPADRAAIDRDVRAVVDELVDAGALAAS